VKILCEIPRFLLTNRVKYVKLYTWKIVLFPTERCFQAVNVGRGPEMSHGHCFSWLVRKENLLEKYLQVKDGRIYFPPEIVTEILGDKSIVDRIRAILLDRQDYKCLICSVHQANCKTTFHVDHDHETGEIRGVLCGPCNANLKRLRKNPAIMKATVEYLEKHQ
jgi:hypothetical protein